MAYGIIGDDPINRAAAMGGGDTFINVSTPAPCRGILKLWSTYVTTLVGGTMKVKVFRDDGTNYVFIGESATISVAGLSNVNLPCWISVEKGDLIALYSVDVDSDAGSTANQIKNKVGDVTTTTLKSAWSDQNGPLTGTNLYKSGTFLTQ